MQHGSVVVETALLTALLAVLAIIAADATAAWRLRTVLVAAAREGARVASLVPNLRQNDPAAVAVIDEVLTGAGIKPGLAGRVVSFSAPLAPGDPVTATVLYAFQPSAPGLTAAFGGPVPLRAEAHMPYRGSGAAASAAP